MRIRRRKAAVKQRSPSAFRAKPYLSEPPRHIRAPDWHFVGPPKLVAAIAMRYYFDFRDGQSFVEDHHGINCPNVDAAKMTASVALAEYTREVVASSDRRVIYVEVRTESGPAFKMKIVFEIEPAP